jgi:aspartyl-tRNA(Asn)/glutamyl-tRNA(Gln) amidotransferase subunit C
MSFMDSKQLQHLARLARLSLPIADEAGMAQKVARVMDSVRALEAIDTSGVPPLAHPHDEAAALRADAVGATDRLAELEGIAPQTQGGYFLVPRVLE